MCITRLQRHCGVPVSLVLTTMYVQVRVPDGGSHTPEMLSGSIQCVTETPTLYLFDVVRFWAFSLMGERHSGRVLDASSNLAGSTMSGIAAGHAEYVSFP